MFIRFADGTFFPIVSFCVEKKEKPSHSTIANEQQTNG